MHREVEEVLQHVDRRTWGVVLIDLEGNWVRDEFEDMEAAEAVCRELGIRMHRCWEDPGWHGG